MPSTTAPQLWQLDDLKAEILRGLKQGEFGDAKVIDGRALAVKASPERENATRLVIGMGACPPNGYQTPSHSHEAEEIAFFLSGRGWVEIEGERYPVEPGSLLLTPSGAEHRTCSADPEDPLVVLWMYAPPGDELRWIYPDQYATTGPAD